MHAVVNGAPTTAPDLDDVSDVEELRRTRRDSDATHHAVRMVSPGFSANTAEKRCHLREISDAIIGDDADAGSVAATVVVDCTLEELVRMYSFSQANDRQQHSPRPTPGSTRVHAPTHPSGHFREAEFPV